MRDIDQIIDSIRNTFPTVKVRQLKVLHPGADDDGLWFFERSDTGLEVQIESPNGMCPFLIEADNTASCFTTTSVDQTIETLAGLLRSAPTHD